MQKPRLSFWQIWNMSFGFLGIQFGWTLQMNNMSAIYEYLGARADQLPFLWLAAPLTGLLVQPFIGMWSDNTWGPLGRRRPFFLAGAVLSSIALVLMPKVGAIWMAAGLLWILDASINVSMEPFRAFVADMLPDEQRARGFTMQSFFIGVGSVAASFLPLVLLRFFPIAANRASTGAVPRIVQISFWAGAVAFMGAVLVTILTTKEYPPSEEEKTRLKHAKRFDFAEFRYAFVNMPKTMRQLFLVQVTTWLGLFCIFLYFPVAVAHNVFGATSAADPRFTQGVIWAGYCSGAYNAFCFISAPLLPLLAANIGKRGTHMVCLALGGISLLSIAVIHSKMLLFVPMLGLGVAWASILSMPFAILSAAIPPRHMGIYMGLFNASVVLPEIFSALFFGFIMSHFMHNNRMLAVVMGGVCFLLAAGLVLNVKEARAADEDTIPLGAHELSALGAD